MSLLGIIHPLLEGEDARVVVICLGHQIVWDPHRHGGANLLLSPQVLLPDLDSLLALEYLGLIPQLLLLFLDRHFLFLRLQLLMLPHVKLGLLESFVNAGTVLICFALD